MVAGPCLSTEEDVSIICGDAEADNEESDCCGEDLISKEVISASVNKRRRKLDPAVPTLLKRAIILMPVLHRAPCPSGDSFIIYSPFSEYSYLVRVMTVIHHRSNYYVRKPPVLTSSSEKKVHCRSRGSGFLDGVVFLEIGLKAKY